MLSVRFEPPAAKYIKKLKDKKLKTLYREAIDKICNRRGENRRSEWILWI